MATAAPGENEHQDERMDDVITMLHELGDVLSVKDSVQDVLNHVLVIASRMVPDCDSASVTVLHDGHPYTIVATDTLTRGLDRQQYALDSGPCQDSIERRVTNRVYMDEARQRWPGFVQIAQAAGFGSYLATPLDVHGQALGALNLFSSQRAGFDQLDESLMTVLASAAAASLSIFLRYTDALALADQLRDGMESRGIIGQAIGILMVRQGISSEDAFAELREQSQRRNMKLRHVAAEYVRDASPTGLPEPAPCADTG